MVMVFRLDRVCHVFAVANGAIFKIVAATKQPKQAGKQQNCVSF